MMQRGSRDQERGVRLIYGLWMDTHTGEIQYKLAAARRGEWKFRARMRRCRQKIPLPFELIICVCE